MLVFHGVETPPPEHAAPTWSAAAAAAANKRGSKCLRAFFAAFSSLGFLLSFIIIIIIIVVGPAKAKAKATTANIHIFVYNWVYICTTASVSAAVCVARFGSIFQELLILDNSPRFVELIINTLILHTPYRHTHTFHLRFSGAPACCLNCFTACLPACWFLARCVADWLTGWLRRLKCGESTCVFVF